MNTYPCQRARLIHPLEHGTKEIWVRIGPPALMHGDYQGDIFSTPCYQTPYYNPYRRRLWVIPQGNVELTNDFADIEERIACSPDDIIG